MPCHFSCILMMFVLNSPACKWLFVIPVPNASVFLSRKCVAVMFFLASSLLMTPVSTFLECECCIAYLHFKLLMMFDLVALDCKWLLCIAVFHACQ